MALINENMGIPNKMELGLTRTRDSYDPKHPLEVSEKNFHSNYEKAVNAQARQMQGFAAPLHFKIEKAAIAKVGHLPCITQRSTLQVLNLFLTLEVSETLLKYAGPLLGKHELTSMGEPRKMFADYI